MSPKRNCHEATHYLSCRQFSGSTFGRLVSKWKNYFNYCTALNYSLWKKWWQVCSRAITFPLPLASLSLLMKKPLHTTQSERDRERRVFVHQFSNLLQWWRISIKLKKKQKNPHYHSRSTRTAGGSAVPKSGDWNQNKEGKHFPNS